MSAPDVHAIVSWDKQGNVKLAMVDGMLDSESITDVFQREARTLEWKEALRVACVIIVGAGSSACMIGTSVDDFYELLEQTLDDTVDRMVDEDERAEHKAHLSKMN